MENKQSNAQIIETGKNLCIFHVDNNDFHSLLRRRAAQTDRQAGDETLVPQEWRASSIFYAAVFAFALKLP
jgi:hypothetical protein